MAENRVRIPQSPLATFSVAGYSPGRAVAESFRALFMTLESEPLTTAVTPPPMAGKGTLSTQVPAGPRALSPRLPTRRLSHSSDRQGAPQAGQRGLLHDGRRVGLRPPGGRWRAQPRSLESVFPETRSNARLGCAPLAWPPAPLTWDCRVALSPLWHKTGR